MNIGEWINTPRFCNVRIDEIFESREKAFSEKFTEPTHYHKDPEYDVFGKSIQKDRMIFAAVKK